MRHKSFTAAYLHDHLVSAVIVAVYQNEFHFASIACAFGIDINTYSDSSIATERKILWHMVPF